MKRGLTAVFTFYDQEGRRMGAVRLDDLKPDEAMKMRVAKVEGWLEGGCHWAYELATPEDVADLLQALNDARVRLAELEGRQPA